VAANRNAAIGGPKAEGPKGTKEMQRGCNVNVPKKGGQKKLSWRSLAFQQDYKKGSSNRGEGGTFVHVSSKFKEKQMRQKHDGLSRNKLSQRGPFKEGQGRRKSTDISGARQLHAE